MTPDPLRDLAKGGRPPLEEWLRPLAAIMRSYDRLSLRRERGRFRQLASLRVIPRVPSYNVPSKYLLLDSATPILQSMLIASGAPCMSLEEDFAIDSTGMRLDAYGPYVGDKHGEARKHRYLKLHLIVGCRTHVVAGAIITEEHGEGSADCPNLPGLLDMAVKAGWRVKEVMADKAYLSRENYAFIESLGAQGFIPFKTDSIALAKGVPEWKRMFYFFQLYRGRFDAQYHKRSNVEAVIAAIKKKLGDRIRSMHLRSRMNEALCILIAYNLTVVAHEIFEHRAEMEAQPGLLPPDFLRLVDEGDLFPNRGSQGDLCSQTPPSMDGPDRV